MESLAKSDTNFCLEVLTDGRLRLKEDHDYYYQVNNQRHHELSRFMVSRIFVFFYQILGTFQRYPNDNSALTLQNENIRKSVKWRHYPDQVSNFFLLLEMEPNRPHYGALLQCPRIYNSKNDCNPEQVKPAILIPSKLHFKTFTICHF